MYLNHFVIPGTAASFITAAREIVTADWLVFLVALAGCILQSSFVAMFTFLLVERPGLLARTRFLRWYNGKAAASSTASPRHLE
jgi:hypothetical protein